MTYILIVMWMGLSNNYSGKAALTMEFNSLKSCQAAAAEIKRQEQPYAIVGTLVCAEKGKK